MYIHINKIPLWFSLKNFFESNEKFIRLEKIKLQNIELDINSNFLENDISEDFKKESFLEILEFKYLTLSIYIFYFILEFLISAGFIKLLSLPCIKNVFIISQRTQDPNLWINILNILDISKEQKSLILSIVIEFIIESYFMIINHKSTPYKYELESFIDSRFDKTIKNVPGFHFNILNRFSKFSLLTLYNYIQKIDDQNYYFPKSDNLKITLQPKNFVCFNLTWCNSSTIKKLFFIEFEKRKNMKKNNLTLYNILENEPEY